MKYVALLRGIMPMNPNMRNEKLKGAFESLGFQSVQTVIASGNVLFETDNGDERALETMIEKTLPEQLGFTSTAIIRSQTELETLVDKDPFKGRQDSPAQRLNVTFLKQPASSDPDLPRLGENFEVVAASGREVCTIITVGTTVDFMALLEKKFGKDITTRTWKTVARILAKF